ncbi:hypothetical protein J5TS1_33530 [Bacillus licheniformis]|nr:hypothetical protein J5TS1_33530 [Bacillus licheniformis]
MPKTAAKTACAKFNPWINAPPVTIVDNEMIQAQLVIVMLKIDFLLFSGTDVTAKSSAFV